MAWTNFVIKSKLKKLAGQNLDRMNNFCTLNDAKSILLFVHSRDLSQAEPYITQLKEKGKTISVIVYLPKKDKREEVYFFDQIVSVKDDFWGVPSKEAIEKVSAYKADILIDITRPYCYAIKYLAFSNPSLFKVGVKWEDTDTYDLSLAVTDNSNIPYLFEQILFYLQTIRSK
jgi:hypothetical protein